MSRNIIFVAGIHGNEQIPVKALSENGIQFILGNPNAYEQNVRYTEEDLNSVFGINNNTYESKRASEILKEIDESDLVVDFHTTSATTEPFAIVVDEKMISFAKMTSLKYVVVMKHNIKEGNALINYRNGISIEAGNHNDKNSYLTTLQIVNNIRADKKHPTIVYEVYDKITQPGEYINFQKHKEGFIPILAGEVSYDFYGLKAKKW